MQYTEDTPRGVMSSTDMAMSWPSTLYTGIHVFISPRNTSGTTLTHRDGKGHNSPAAFLLAPPFFPFLHPRI